MKIRSTGMHTKRKLNPPRMINGVKTSEYDAVILADVIRVDELVAWCNTNPEVSARTLATSIENGEFR